MRSHNLFAVIALFIASTTAACAPRFKSTNDSQTSTLEIKSVPLIDEEITQTIARHMQNKCDVLFGESPQDKENCYRASVAMSHTLDFNYIKRNDGQSAFVFMHKRLKELLNSPKTHELISRIHTASEDALYLNKNFNLWELTLAHTDNNPESATEILAILFQDSAQTAAQIKYLMVSQHPAAVQLQETLKTIEEALKKGNAKAYPAEINLQRTAHYHYYVPRYLAQKLRAAGVGADMSRRIPFLFNSTYELHQIQKFENPVLANSHKPVSNYADTSPEIHRLIEKWNAYDELYTDLIDHLNAPLIPFDQTQHENNIQDLYLGYRGALDGIDKKSPSSVRTLSEFADLFSNSPSAFIKN